MSTATLAVTCFKCQVVAFLCPQVLNALFLTPAARPTARSQVRQHLRLPLTETITMHPHTLIACLVVTVHLNDISQVFTPGLHASLLQYTWTTYHRYSHLDCTPRCYSTPEPHITGIRTMITRLIVTVHLNDISQVSLPYLQCHDWQSWKWETKNREIRVDK